jgi:hypothetical protein
MNLTIHILHQDVDHVWSCKRLQKRKLDVLCIAEKIIIPIQSPMLEKLNMTLSGVDAQRQKKRASHHRGSQR